MIDTHAHLFADEFTSDVAEVISRARMVGVNKIMCVGFSKDTNQKALELSIKYPNYLYLTAGLHPSEANTVILNDIKYLEDFICTYKVYAVGECGLDYYWDKTYKDEQIAIFKAQIELSIKYNLPLIIHCRDAIKDTYDILKEYPKAYGVMHCYSGSLEMAYEFIKLGYYIGLDGPVTFKNARVPKEVAKNIPLERLLIETDCPYMAPVPNRGKRNEPSFLEYILTEIASLRGIEKKKLEEILDKNSNTLFKLEVTDEKNS